MDPQTIVITGAGRGLGVELARQYIGRGDRVWGTIRAGRHGEAANMNLAGLVELDLADEASIVNGATQLSEEIDAIDVLINCAGVDARAFGAPSDKRGPFEVAADAFTDVTRVNATGPMVLTRELLPLLRKAAPSLVLNISSQLGSMQLAATMGRDTAYCVSKAALNMWSVKAAAHLRAEEIAVVMLHPGWVQTDMGGSNASLTATESAAAIVSTIEGLSLADTGRFIRWDGTDHPW